MTFFDVLHDTPVAALLLVALLLLIPLVLRLSGLSGAQILELLKSTLQFFLDTLREMRTPKE